MELLEELNLFWTTIMYDDPQPSWKQRQSLIVIMIGGKVADMILKTNLVNVEFSQRRAVIVSSEAGKLIKAN